MPVLNTRVEGEFKPLRDGILVRNMEFGEQRTESGLIIASDDGKTSGIHPRWGEVIAVGNEQQDVQVGQFVLVSHGRWSRGFELNGETVRTVSPFNSKPRLHRPCDTRTNCPTLTSCCSLPTAITSPQRG